MTENTLTPLPPTAGRVAARNMLGKEEVFSSIPYFWTVLFGKSLRYCGEWREAVCIPAVDVSASLSLCFMLRPRPQLG